MGLFAKKKNTEKGLMQLHSLLTNSFKNVQKDTAHILNWLNYFYQKNLQQEQLINHLHNKNLRHEQALKDLKDQLNYMPKSREEIRKIVDEFYSYEAILSRIKELDSRIEDIRKSHLSLHKSHEDLHQKHHEMGSKIEELSVQRTPLVTQKMPIAEMDELHRRLEKLEQKKATIKEKIIKQITKNSKDYIKSIILSYIKKYDKITALQLKEMIVEEQGLCSKSSFYRLLEEIEEEPEIGVIKKGKEKHYIAKISKKNY